MFLNLQLHASTTWEAFRTINGPRPRCGPMKSEFIGVEAPPVTPLCRQGWKLLLRWDSSTSALLTFGVHCSLLQGLPPRTAGSSVAFLALTHYMSAATQPSVPGCDNLGISKHWQLSLVKRGGEGKLALTENHRYKGEKSALLSLGAQQLLCGCLPVVWCCYFAVFKTAHFSYLVLCSPFWPNLT